MFQRHHSPVAYLTRGDCRDVEAVIGIVIVVAVEVVFGSSWPEDITRMK